MAFMRLNTILNGDCQEYITLAEKRIEKAKEHFAETVWEADQ
jgi:hypothetical protein